MKSKGSFKLVFVLVLLLLSCGCMFMANNIQRDKGSVKISDGVLHTEAGDLTYKLYQPKSATETNKAPAVLLLHGYQNDHETCAAYSMELSRRGYVVWHWTSMVTVPARPAYSTAATSITR